MKKKRFLSVLLTLAIVAALYPSQTARAGSGCDMNIQPGCIYANGKPIIIAAGGDSSLSFIYYDPNENGVVDGDAPFDLVEKGIPSDLGNITDGYDLTAYSVSGASQGVRWRPAGLS